MKLSFPRSVWKRIYICLFLRRKEWLLARAATRLYVHAWNTGNDRLLEQMDEYHDALWKRVYPEDNPSCHTNPRTAN